MAGGFWLSFYTRVVRIKKLFLKRTTRLLNTLFGVVGGIILSFNIKLFGPAGWLATGRDGESWQCNMNNYDLPRATLLKKNASANLDVVR